MKILFVCHGNINRSAAGEIILQKLKPDWEIKSAALKDTNGGEITAKKMRLALTEKGFPTDGIRSTPISKELVDWADVIFYMDDSNEKRLFSKFGVDASKKSIRISSLIGEKKIPDPNFAKDNELHKKVVDMLVNALTLYINDGATNPWIID